MADVDSADFRISIVIVALNELTHLRQSIPLILQQRCEIPYDVLVVDSGSTDGSHLLYDDFAQSDARLKYTVIPASTFHHARTRNFGATLVHGELLVYLGGDAVPVDVNWLQNLISPIVRQRGLVVASYGRQVPRSTADSANTCRMLFNYPMGSRLQNRSAALSPRATYFLSSVNCCVDRRYVRSPLFDSSFSVNEDISLSSRIIAQGLSIAYQADAVVTHSHDYSAVAMFRRSFDNGATYARLGVLKRKNSRVARDGSRYLFQSLVRTAGTAPLDIPRVLLLFGASAIGLSLGIRYRSLPRPIANRIGKYPVMDA